MIIECSEEDRPLEIVVTFLVHEHGPRPDYEDDRLTVIGRSVQEGDEPSGFHVSEGRSADGLAAS